MRYLAVLLLFIPGLALCQSNSVTVTVNRAITLVPDRVVFTVTAVTSPIGTFEDALAAVQGAGVTAEHFNSVWSSTVFDSGEIVQNLSWEFQFPVALTSLKSTADKLATLQRSGRGSNGVAVTFRVSSSETSPAARTARESQACPVADLLAEARVQAVKLASAAGSPLGQVIAVSGSTGNGSYYTSSGCTLTVKFALGVL